MTVEFIEKEEVDEPDRYLLFRLGEEMYGTPLLGVREVVEPQEPKPVPNTQPYFRGVINIRGEIVGTIDLRLRLGHDAVKGPNNALMVFNTSHGPIAALVDRVEAVAKIPNDDIEHEPNIKTTVPLDYLVGIAKCGKNLITLIDLNRALGMTEVGARTSTSALE